MKSEAEIAAAVQRGQVAAFNLMRDKIRITRDSPVPPSTDRWGRITAPPPAVVYEGRGKVQTDATYPVTPEIAGTSRALTTIAQVHLPFGTTSVRSGDVAEVIESRNPRLIGTKVRLRSDEDKTWTTAVHFNVEEVVA